MAILTLDEALAQLRIPADSDADIAEIDAMLLAVDHLIENHLHEVVEVREVVEEVDLAGRATFLLSTQPVVSLTSLIGLDGTVFDAAGMHASPNGVVRVVATANPAGPAVATYQAGYTTIPENYKQGARVALQHVWETQRGLGSVPSGVIGGEETFDPRFSYTLPRKAVEWLGAPRPVVA